MTFRFKSNALLNRTSLCASSNLQRYFTERPAIGGARARAWFPTIPWHPTNIYPVPSLLFPTVLSLARCFLSKIDRQNYGLSARCREISLAVHMLLLILFSAEFAMILYFNGCRPHLSEIISNIHMCRYIRISHWLRIKFSRRVLKIFWMKKSFKWQYIYI